MSDLGETLRAAREAKGLTIRELAAKTRILDSILNGLENDDYSRLPAPIYGRGFVKLYCEAVGIRDSKTMIDAFMRIYDDVKNHRPIASAPAAAPALAQEPPKIAAPAIAPSPAPIKAPTKTPIPTPIPTPIHTQVRPAAPAPRAVTEPIAPEPPPAEVNFQSDEFRLESDTIPRPPKHERPIMRLNPPSITRRPTKQPSVRRIHIPQSVWRVGLLAIVGFGLVWIAATGVNALRRTTMNNKSQPVRQTPVVYRQTTQPASPDAAVAAEPRALQKVEPLYID